MSIVRRVLTVVAFAVALPAPDAGACLWDGSEELSMARDALDAGDWANAVALAMGTKYASTALVPLGTPDVALDLQRVAALAIVRSQGKASVFGEAGFSAEHRARVDLAWAQLVLNYRMAMGHADPRDMVDLAEVLAADPFGKARARDILRELAARDVMPNARGTELLARLDRDAHA